MTTFVRRGFLGAVVATALATMRNPAEAFLSSTDRIAVASLYISDRSAFRTTTTSTTTELRMGLLDSVLGRFRGNKNDDDDDDDADFVRLESMSKEFLGPGPVVLLYQIPDGIDDEEIRDILADSAPKATKKGISMARIASLVSYDKTNRNLVNMSLQKALERVIRKPPPPYILAPGITTHQVQSNTEVTEGSPVVIFSGFENSEMMDCYNILGEELYKETAATSEGRGQYLACARAVPNAMKKPLKQVLTEISGDHADAMAERGGA